METAGQGAFRPDQGWSWLVLAAAFVCNVIFDGLIFSFGVFKLELTHYFGEGLGPVAWIGATIGAVYALVGPVASVLANKFGCRVVTVGGSLLAAAGFMASTFSPNIWVMIVTYGIMGGVGFGLMYLCAYVMIGHYFEKRRALATGIASCGSGVGTFLFAPLSDVLIIHYGWKGAMWIMTGIILNGVVMGMIFRPVAAETQVIILPSKDAEVETKTKRKLISLSLLRSPAFVIFCISSFLCLIGFLVPFIYLPDVALGQGYSHESSVLLVSIIGLTNTAGRIACGWVSDKSWADPLKIYNVALIVGGAATAACTWVSGQYAMLAVYAAIFGVCVAAYVSLCAIILVEFLGLEKLSNAFGFLNFCRGIATIIGAPLAGFLYDTTQSFHLPFYVAGASIAAAGVICLPLRMLSHCKRSGADQGGVCKDLDPQLSISDLKTMEANAAGYHQVPQKCRRKRTTSSEVSDSFISSSVKSFAGFTGSISSIAGFVSPSPSVTRCNSIPNSHGNTNIRGLLAEPAGSPQIGTVLANGNQSATIHISHHSHSQNRV